jgi:hypothetical protein
MHAPALGIGAVYLVLIGGLATVSIQTFTRLVLVSTGTVLVFVALTVALLPAARLELKQRIGSLRRSPPQS